MFKWISHTKAYSYVIIALAKFVIFNIFIDNNSVLL